MSSALKRLALGSARGFVQWQTELSAASNAGYGVFARLSQGIAARPKLRLLKFCRLHFLFCIATRSRSISCLAFETLAGSHAT